MLIIVQKNVSNFDKYDVQTYLTNADLYTVSIAFECSVHELLGLRFSALTSN